MMTPLQLAQQYMNIVFSGENLDALGHLFADDFSFSGPLYHFDSAKSYIESLKLDPPVGFEYKIIQSFENDSSACLIYQFSKPGVSVPMTQLFEVSDGRISRILLVFDTGAFD